MQQWNHSFPGQNCLLVPPTPRLLLLQQGSAIVTMPVPLAWSPATFVGMHPSQCTAQGHQTVGSWHWQGPDQHPLGVCHQHPQREHDTAAPSETMLVQAWGRPESPVMTDCESAWQEGPTDGQQLCWPADQHYCATAHERPPLQCGWHRLSGPGHVKGVALGRVAFGNTIMSWCMDPPPSPPVC